MSQSVVRELNPLRKHTPEFNQSRSCRFGWRAALWIWYIVCCSSNRLHVYNMCAYHKRFSTHVHCIYRPQLSRLGTLHVHVHCMYKHVYYTYDIVSFVSWGFKNSPPIYSFGSIYAIPIFPCICTCAAIYMSKLPAKCVYDLRIFDQ